MLPSESSTILEMARDLTGTNAEYTAALGPPITRAPTLEVRRAPYR
jgi:hypothetical protein